MKRKQETWKKLVVVLLAVFSLSILFPEFAPGIGGVQTVQAAQLNTRKLTMIKGQKKTLKLKGTSKKAKWSSSKKSVASISSAGKVTAKKAGTAVITAKIGKNKYTCKVTVEAPKLNKTSVTLYTGGKYQLKLTGTKQNVTWTNSNKTVATVSKKGLITAKKAGTATITANVGGKKYKCKVTVKTTTPSDSQAAAYEKLKKYITATGAVNSNGNKVISINTTYKDVVYTWGIVYDQSANVMEFILSTSGSSSRSATDMKVLVKSDEASVTFIFINSGDRTGYKAAISLNGKEYDGVTPVNFEITKNAGVQVSYDLMNKQANAYLKVGFSGWQKMLLKKAGVSFNDLGFTAYKG